MRSPSTSVWVVRRLGPCVSVLAAAGILGASLAAAAEPPGLDEIKTRLNEQWQHQRRNIESLHLQTKRQFKSPLNAEDLSDMWDLWTHFDVREICDVTREEDVAFKGKKRYYHYVECGGDLSTPPPAPELAPDATPMERARHQEMVQRRQRFEENLKAGLTLRTVCTRMDFTRGFNGRMLWERTAAERTRPDGRTVQQRPSVRRYEGLGRRRVPGGTYLPWVGWGLLGEDLAMLPPDTKDYYVEGSLPELLQRWPYSVSKVTEVVDGAECVVLTRVAKPGAPAGAIHQRLTDRLWLDLDHGLALRKREWTTSPGRGLFRQVNAHWHEFAPAFWLPKQIEVQTVVPSEATRYPQKCRGRVVLTRHVTLLKCIVNRVPDDLFEVPGDQPEDTGRQP